MKNVLMEPSTKRTRAKVSKQDFNEDQQILRDTQAEGNDKKK